MEVDIEEVDQVDDIDEMVVGIEVAALQVVVGTVEVHHQVEDIEVIRQLQEVVDMMEHAEKMARDLLDHQDVMMVDDMLHALHVMMIEDTLRVHLVVKVAKVVIADIVIMIHDLHVVTDEIHLMVHKELQNSLSSLCFREVHYFPFFYAKTTSYSKSETNLSTRL